MRRWSFSYDLDNNTDADYRFAKGAGTVVMTRLKSNGSLSSEAPIELNNSVFLPARNRTRIALQVTRPFNWPTRPAGGTDRSGESSEIPAAGGRRSGEPERICDVRYGHAFSD